MGDAWVMFQIPFNVFYLIIINNLCFEYLVIMWFIIVLMAIVCVVFVFSIEDKEELNLMKYYFAHLPSQHLVV